MMHTYLIISSIVLGLLVTSAWAMEERENGDRTPYNPSIPGIVSLLTPNHSHSNFSEPNSSHSLEDMQQELFQAIQQVNKTINSLDKQFEEEERNNIHNINILEDLETRYNKLDSKLHNCLYSLETVAALVEDTKSKKYSVIRKLTQEVLHHTSQVLNHEDEEEDYTPLSSTHSNNTENITDPDSIKTRASMLFAKVGLTAAHPNSSFMRFLEKNNTRGKKLLAIGKKNPDLWTLLTICTVGTTINYCCFEPSYDNLLGMLMSASCSIVLFIETSKTI